MSRENLLATQINMPTVTSVAGGSLVALTLTPASVGIATVAKQSLSVAGLVVGDSVIPLANPITNAVALTGADVIAPGLLRLTFTNPTAGALVPTAGTYTFLVIKGS